MAENWHVICYAHNLYDTALVTVDVVTSDYLRESTTQRCSQKNLLGHAMPTPLGCPPLPPTPLMSHMSSDADTPRIVTRTLLLATMPVWLGGDRVMSRLLLEEPPDVSSENSQIQ